MRTKVQPSFNRVLFGNRIKKIRIDLGVTQKNLAEGIGVERVTILNIERGKSAPPIKTIIALIDFFSACGQVVSLDYLFGVSEFRNEDEAMGKLKISYDRVANEVDHLKEVIMLRTELLKLKENEQTEKR